MDVTKFLEKFETSSVDSLVELAFLVHFHNVALKVYYLAQNKELKFELLNSQKSPVSEIMMCFTDVYDVINPLKSI